MELLQISSIKGLKERDVEQLRQLMPRAVIRWHIDGHKVLPSFYYFPPSSLLFLHSCNSPPSYSLTHFLLFRRVFSYAAGAVLCRADSHLQTLFYMEPFPYSLLRPLEYPKLCCKTGLRLRSFYRYIVLKLGRIDAYAIVVMMDL
jgi:hypothetical protein